MTDGGVVVDEAGLARRWRRFPNYDVWVAFRPSRPGVEVDEVEAAVDAANAEADPDDERMVEAEGPWLTPLEPVEHVVLAPTPASLEDLMVWVGRFAEALRAAGLDGTVGPAKEADDRIWEVVNRIAWPQLTAFLAFSVENPFPSRTMPSRWNVSPAVTAAAVELVRRGGFPGAQTLLWVGRLRQATPDAAADGLRRVLPRDSVCQATHIRPDPPRVVNTAYFVNGMVKHLVYDPARSWRQRLDDYAEALRLVAPHLDVGFVQCGTGADSSWQDSLDRGPPTLPGTREYHIHGNRHLLLAQVPDARGIQVLTDRHLERAVDLTGWTVEDLGAGRHLVVAADLEAWYGRGAPDPEVLAEARAAFGPMIVSLEDIRPPLQP